MREKNRKYVVGVDGGGTKTVAVLSDLKGKILRRIEIGPSNPNKIGLEKAIFNLKKLISQTIKGYPKNKIGFCYLGLAGGLERDRQKSQEIEKILQKEFVFLVKVEGDQKIAFRAGIESKDGVLIIAGTGSISIGWKGKKEAISGGWDWLLGDQGSAFWVGKKALEETIKSFDGRAPSSELKNLIFKKWTIREEKDLYQKFYQPDFVEKISSLSKIVDLVAEKGDKIAKKILAEAGKELAQMAISVIKKLNFKKEKFPIVLVGGMFKSKIVLNTIKKEIKTFALRAEFIIPKKEPVVGAIKLAVEKLNPVRNLGQKKFL